VQSNTPNGLQAAAPSADFDHKSPGHRSAVSRLRPQVARPSQHRQPTSTTCRPLPLRPTAEQQHQEAPLQAPHNSSCVFTERVNKGAYHLQPSMDCGGNTHPHTHCVLYALYCIFSFVCCVLLESDVLFSVICVFCVLNLIVVSLPPGEKQICKSVK
jgi:hypothetical protein